MIWAQRLFNQLPTELCKCFHANVHAPSSWLVESKGEEGKHGNMNRSLICLRAGKEEQKALN